MPAEPRKLTTEQHAELMRFAFRQIADPNDWRAPIDAIVPESMVSLCCDAVMFMTATNASVTSVGLVNGSAMYRVTSIGYRSGPAGDR